MPDASPPGRSGGPIFIVGAMGSGTTLLRLVLDSHEHLAVPQETGFMRGYNATRFTPFKWSGRNWTRRLGWSDEELDAVMREHYDRLFMRYAEQHGKRRWGEKTPLHTWHVDNMARVFPDASFIGVVRHPCASVASNMRRFNAPLKKNTTHWGRYSREVACQAARHPERFIVLRYEDLVLRPERVLREVLDWLGEPWSDAVLEHHAVQGERGGRKQVEGKSRVDDPIDVSRISRWTTQLTPRQRRHISRRHARLARYFGYDATEPATLEPLARDGRLVASGAEMAARMDLFPGLDLREPGAPTVYESPYDPRKLMILRREDHAELVRAAKSQKGARGRRGFTAEARRAAAGLRRRLRRPGG